MILVLKTNEGIVRSEFKNVDKLNLDYSTGLEDRYTLLKWLISNMEEGQWLDQKHKKSKG
ncbi:hypothetical protein LCGC14_2346830 [marine sediment metagenome]|uniref:Uncharacterized protein n=1 Tax=marine sediment metagenome TaxID=412755 RepID=A0A0F9CXW9_9ZZZZ